MFTRPIPTASDLQDQLTDLKGEILELSRALSATAGDAADRSKPTINQAGDILHDFADTVRGQGQALAGAAWDNPGKTTSIVLSAALVGLGLWWLVDATSSGSTSSRWRS